MTTSIAKYEQQKQDLNHVKALAKIASESKQYANMSEVQLLNLMLSAKDLGISPMKAINGGFYVVNGKVCMSTTLMADRIRKEGHSIKVIEMTKDKCILLGVRSDNKDSYKCEYTWEEAQTAGLTGGPTWKKFPKIMLYNRCMSLLARVLFPDVLGSSYSEEERFDIQNVPAEQRPEEDPEEIVTIPVEERAGLTEEESAVLDSYLQEDKEAIEIIKERLSLDDVYNIEGKDYKRIINWLEKRKEEKKNGQTRVA